MPIVRFAALVALLLSIATAGSAAEPKNRSFAFADQQRSYCLYVPESAPKNAPVAILLHGSDRSGCYVAKLWKKSADVNGIVLAAPDALKSDVWGAWNDPPAMFTAMVADLGQQASIDQRRLYLFGHSAGGHYALALGILESKYFAAVAVFAGALSPKWKEFVKFHQRNIPIAMFEGRNDPVVPPSAARDTRDFLTTSGFPVEFHELPNTGHTYERYADNVNPDIWAFFSKVALDNDPEFQDYVVKKPR